MKIFNEKMFYLPVRRYLVWYIVTAMFKIFLLIFLFAKGNVVNIEIIKFSFDCSNFDFGHAKEECQSLDREKSQTKSIFNGWSTCRLTKNTTYGSTYVVDSRIKWIILNLFNLTCLKVTVNRFSMNYLDTNNQIIQIRCTIVTNDLFTFTNNTIYLKIFIFKYIYI